MNIPNSHPRYESLRERHLIEEGVKDGMVTPTGMIAQGRGEAFDYLIGEKTTDSALAAIRAAISLMKASNCVTISVNGNVAALCAKDVVSLADSLNAKIEVNLFYWMPAREKKVANALIKAGAKKVYGTKDKIVMPGIDHNRGKIDPEGISSSDCVLVMLEDGDRTCALKNMGKKVIAIDLNPFSRTAIDADITIVDNVVRAVPKMLELAKNEVLNELKFDNKKNLFLSKEAIMKNLSQED